MTTKILLVLVLFGVAGLIYCEDFLPVEGLITHLGKTYTEPDKWVTSSQNTTTVAYNEPEKARYIRVQIRREQMQDEKWYLAVRDGNGRLVQSFTDQSFQDNDVQWTTRIPGSSAVFNFYARPGSSTRVYFERKFVMPEAAKNPYYSWLGNQPRYKDLYEVENGRYGMLGDFTSFLLISWETDSWCCSGILLTPTLLLTNWHCGNPQKQNFPASATWNPLICKNALVDLSWDGDSSSSEYVCQEVMITNEALDYALIKIRPNIAGNTARAALISSDLQKDQNILIVHHAQGLQKQISHGCSVADVGDKFFFHNCDTAGGSSGGPVFDDHGALVGIHRRGFKKNAATKLNESIRIDRIIDDIRKQKPALATEFNASN